MAIFACATSLIVYEVLLIVFVFIAFCRRRGVAYKFDIFLPLPFVFIVCSN